uniref:Tetraspanin n=1 Tax=Cyprinus carpio carpio TaxID=630221 RepID=A0A9J8CEK8_CYPCA
MMKMSIQMCRCFLISSNILFAMVGFGLVCLGTWVRIIASVTGFYQISLKTSPFSIGVTVLVITGILITLAGVLGNLGACSFKISALNVFSGLLSFLIIINIAVGVTAFVKSGQTSDELSELYRKIYTSHTRSSNETMILRLLHKTFDCSGIGEQRDTCPEGNFQKQSTFLSCPSVIQDVFNSNAPLVLVGFLGIAGLMMLALVCSVILSRYISKNPASSSGTNSQLERMHMECIESLCHSLIDN